MKRPELEALAQELGANLTNEGRRFIATFPDKLSKVFPDRPVQLTGTREELSKTLVSIKRSQERRANAG